MKKAQLFGQPFVYIFAMVVAALILIFGLNLTYDIIKGGKEISGNILLDDIEKNYNSVFRDSYGSVKSLSSIKVPGSLDEICFVYFDCFGNIDYNLIGNSRLRMMIEAESNSDRDKNVFVSGAKQIYVKELDSLKIEDCIICDSLDDGKIDVKFINQGEDIFAVLI